MSLCRWLSGACIGIRTGRNLLRRRRLLVGCRALKISCRATHWCGGGGIVIIFGLSLHQVVVLKETVDPHRHSAVQPTAEMSIKMLNFGMDFLACRRRLALREYGKA